MVDILSIGKTGLNAAKKSLETTGHNISNVNTKGYSRQRVEQSTNNPIVKHGLIQGTGVRIDSIDRIHDPYVQKRLQKAQSDESYSGKRFSELSQVENIFNEIDRDGLNNVLNNFYNSFRELANQPDNETVRSVVRDKAQLAIRDIKRIRTSLDGLSRSIDNKIEGEIEDINTLLKDVSSLNKKIAALEASGNETGDFRDQRDLKILELSKSFRIHTYNDDRGNFNVSAVGVGTLVAGGSFQELASRGSTKESSSNNMDGSTEVFLKERPANKVTDRFKSGHFSSLIKVRNSDIKKLQDSIDEIAFEFANTVNGIHRRGFVNRPLEAKPDGSFPTSDMKGPTTGLNFFKISNNVSGSASTIELSDEVSADLSNIVTAVSPNSPGDNRVSLAISKLQHEKFMNGGTATIEEHFLKTVGHVGIETGKAKLDSEQAEAIRTQIETIKERTSGVSLDEEAANMVRFQHAYNASAKVMQAANEMFDTILSIKR